MKVLFLGDSHGDLGFLNFGILQAKKFNCDRLVSVGDFGYWEHTQEGSQFLHKLQRMLDREGFVLYWVDGNHENHTLLRELYGPDGPDHQLDPEGFWIIRNNIRYIPRGHRWTWDGVRCLGLGGAVSIDREWRQQMEGRSEKMHTLWWPEEAITEADVQACRAAPIDLMITHDCPDGVDLQGHFWRKNAQFLKVDPASAHNRQMIRRVVETVRPQLLIGGHYHLRMSDTLELETGRTCKVEILDCNANYQQAFLPVDLKEDIS